MSYKNNYYQKILNFLSDKFNITQNTIDGYIYNSLEVNLSPNILVKSKFLSLILFCFLPIVLFVLLFKKNKQNKIKADITVEEISDYCFDGLYKEVLLNFKDKNINRLLYYKRVFHLKDKIKNDFNVILLNDFIDKKTILKVIRILIFNPKFLIYIYKLHYSQEKNFIYGFLKLIIAYIKFNSIAINSNTKVYLSSNDLNFHLLKDEIFKMNAITSILIQSSLRDNSLIYYKGADILFCYGENQKNIYKHKTNNFRKIYEVGSIKNNPFLNKKYEKKFDIIFIEQFADRTNFAHGSNEGYTKILEHLLKFSYEYPEYKVIYRGRKQKREERSHIKIYDDILSKIEKSNIIVNFEGNSYEKVVSSRLTLGYYSTLAFESIGLDVPTIFFYYENYKFEVFDYENSGTDILILDSSYDVFKESILKRLKSDNMEYFRKYKKIYMNQDPDLIKNIVKIVKNV